MRSPHRPGQIPWIDTAPEEGQSRPERVQLWYGVRGRRISDYKEPPIECGIAARPDPHHRRYRSPHRVLEPPFGQSVQRLGPDTDVRRSRPEVAAKGSHQWFRPQGRSTWGHEDVYQAWKMVTKPLLHCARDYDETVKVRPPDQIGESHAGSSKSFHRSMHVQDERHAKLGQRTESEYIAAEHGIRS